MKDRSVKGRRLIKYGLILICATLLGLFSASRLLMGAGYGGYSITFARAIQLSLADWYSWAILTPVIFWLAHRFPLEKRIWLRAVLVHMPASLVLAIIKMNLSETTSRRS